MSPPAQNKPLVSSPWCDLPDSLLAAFSAAVAPLLVGERLSLPVGEGGAYIDLHRYSWGWAIIAHGRGWAGCVGGCMSAAVLARLVRQFTAGHPPQLALF